MLQLSVNSDPGAGSSSGRAARRSRPRNRVSTGEARSKPQLPADFAGSIPERLERAQDARLTLVDLRRGETAVVDRIELPGDDAQRLMELGFLPGTEVTAGQRAPGGDPRVFQVDGSEVALRRETAARVHIRFDRV
jgi:ferrous iron transport protein A